MFDTLMHVSSGRIIMHIGDWLYDVIIRLNDIWSTIRAKMGLRYWSMSKWIKKNTKQAVSYVLNFEKLLADYCKTKGYDGIICGHIHTAEIRDIDGVVYMNDGDWVESLTALVETQSGELKIIHWPRILGDKQQVEEVVIEQPSLPITFPIRIPSPALMAHSNTLPITEKMT